MSEKLKTGWMGTGDYFVSKGDLYLGRVIKTSRKWEAWRGWEGLNCGQEFTTRRAAIEHLVSLEGK